MATSKEDEAVNRIKEVLSTAGHDSEDPFFKSHVAEAKAWKEEFPELFGKVVFLKALQHFRELRAKDPREIKTIRSLDLAFSSKPIEEEKNDPTAAESSVAYRFPVGEHGTSIDYIEDFCTLNKWVRPKYHSFEIWKNGILIHSCLVTLKSNDGKVFREQGVGRSEFAAKNSAAHLLANYMKRFKRKK